jgi:hypothetical protein
MTAPIGTQVGMWMETDVPIMPGDFLVSDHSGRTYLVDSSRPVKRGPNAGRRTRLRVTVVDPSTPQPGDEVHAFEWKPIRSERTRPHRKGASSHDRGQNGVLHPPRHHHRTPWSEHMADHKAEAKEWLSLVDVNDGLDRDLLALKKAEVHAALYLAEQQRVANLIAVRRHLGDPETAGPVNSGAGTVRRLKPEVAALLGLGGPITEGQR